MTKATELLLQSAIPFDEACIKVKRIEDALEMLVKLKNHKDEFGKDNYYTINQPIAWQVAREALE